MKLLYILLFTFIALVSKIAFGIEPKIEIASRCRVDQVLPRDTVQLCYTPFYYGTGEICKYYVFAATFNEGKATWDVSRDYCKSIEELVGVAFDLVAIESKEENTAIKNHIETNFPGQNFWTSGNDFKTNHLYEWAATGYAVTYYDWYRNSAGYGEPNDPLTLNNQTSISLFHDFGELKWHDMRADPYGYNTSTVWRHYPLCEQLD